MSDDANRQGFLSLKAGDKDDDLNKVVSEIILCSEKFVVYLDSDNFVQWKSNVDAKNAGRVLNVVARLEAQSQFIQDKGTLKAIRLRIGTALARCFDGGEESEYNLAFKEVEADIKARNLEVSWRWYFMSAIKLTGFCVFMIIIAWLFRTGVISIIGSNAFYIALGTMCGSIGALLSVMSRSNRLVVDANAGEFLHELEGNARIIAGLIGAFLVCLAIKAKVISTGINFSGSELSFMLLFSIVAGASERLVPSLIINVDKFMESSRISGVK